MTTDIIEQKFIHTSIKFMSIYEPRKWNLTIFAVSLEIFNFFPHICLLKTKSLNLIGFRGDIIGKFLKNIKIDIYA